MQRTVAIVEDEEVVRQALKRGLEFDGTIVCRGVHANAAEALQSIPANPPDVVLMDVVLPGGLSGIECTRKLKAVLPHLPVIMFTGSADRFILFQSLMAGATGFITKTSTYDECRAAVHEVAAGGAPLSRAMALALVQSFHGVNSGSNPSDLLSPREREILACLFQGLSDKEISTLLGIGMATVHTHMHRMFGKLGARNRYEATSKYLGGWVSF